MQNVRAMESRKGWEWMFAGGILIYMGVLYAGIFWIISGIIYYTYTYLGKVYRHKSCMFWKKPNYEKGNSIIVYANESGKSTVLLPDENWCIG